MLNYLLISLYFYLKYNLSKNYKTEDIIHLNILYFIIYVFFLYSTKDILLKTLD